MQLLDIEKELAGENREAAMRKYDAILIGAGNRLREAMDQGMDPAEFAKAQPLAEAIVIARKLLRLQIQKEN